jgi:hypothetical protein
VCAGGEAARTHPNFPRFIEKIQLSLINTLLVIYHT